MTPVRIFRLPLQHHGSAIPITDMYRCLGLHPFGRLFQSTDAPRLNFIKIDVEAGLVELDDVTTVLRQFDSLLVEEFGQLGRQSAPATIMLVCQGIGGRHRPRQGHFHRLGGVTFEKTQSFKQDWPRTSQWPGYTGGVYQLIAVAAAAGGDLDQTAEINPFYPFAKAPNVMPPALFTIGDDIDSGLLLVT